MNYLFGFGSIPYCLPIIFCNLYLIKVLIDLS